MGVEHSFKDEDVPEVMRCPSCEVISVVRAGEDVFCFGLYAGLTGKYFMCQNPECGVERIYGSNCVVTSK